MFPEEKKSFEKQKHQNFDVVPYDRQKSEEIEKFYQNFGIQNVELCET